MKNSKEDVIDLLLASLQKNIENLTLSPNYIPNLNYKSCICINSIPIIPPAMTLIKLDEMRSFKIKASSLEKKMHSQKTSLLLDKIHSIIDKLEPNFDETFINSTHFDKLNQDDTYIETKTKEHLNLNQTFKNNENLSISDQSRNKDQNSQMNILKRQNFDFLLLDAVNMENIKTSDNKINTLFIDQLNCNIPSNKIIEKISPKSKSIQNSLKPIKTTIKYLNTESDKINMSNHDNDLNNGESICDETFTNLYNETQDSSQLSNYLDISTWSSSNDHIDNNQKKDKNWNSKLLVKNQGDTPSSNMVRSSSYTLDKPSPVLLAHLIDTADIQARCQKGSQIYLNKEIIPNKNLENKIIHDKDNFLNQNFSQSLHDTNQNVNMTKNKKFVHCNGHVDSFLSSNNMRTSSPINSLPSSDDKSYISTEKKNYISSNLSGNLQNKASPLIDSSDIYPASRLSRSPSTNIERMNREKLERKDYEKSSKFADSKSILNASEIITENMGKLEHMAKYLNGLDPSPFPLLEEHYESNGASPDCGSFKNFAKYEMRDNKNGEHSINNRGDSYESASQNDCKETNGGCEMRVKFYPRNLCDSDLNSSTLSYRKSLNDYGQNIDGYSSINNDQRSVVSNTVSREDEIVPALRNRRNSLRVKHSRNSYYSNHSNSSNKSLNVVSLEATKLAAYVKGYLVRRLYKTNKIQHLKTTIKDTLDCLYQINIDRQHKHRNDSHSTATHNGDSNHMGNAEDLQSFMDMDLVERLTAQLACALDEIHEIFFEYLPAQKMKIIELDRYVIINKLQRRQPLKITVSKTQRKRLSERQSVIPKALSFANQLNEYL
ncbi:probable crossover junction endonuclease mus81 isoform X2 [Gordionus sp. m RMFG-2023]|uniref:probable crossover junction endonuclease mus81 isoform X2 n=1 Tax=Gordionus sp. m RMFG-2023 TaxID=3053472 RepID=UPI0031FD0E00